MTEEKKELVRKYEQYLRDLQTRCEKIRDQADALGREINQVEYLMREMLAEII